MPLIDDFSIAFLVTNQPNIWYFVEVKAAVSVSWNFNELKTHFLNIYSVDQSFYFTSIDGICPKNTYFELHCV